MLSRLYIFPKTKILLVNLPSIFKLADRTVLTAESPNTRQEGRVAPPVVLNVDLSILSLRLKKLVNNQLSINDYVVAAPYFILKKHEQESKPWFCVTLAVCSADVFLENCL